MLAKLLILLFAFSAEDDADGKDLVALTRHEHVLRSYFPYLKDRLKFLDKSSGSRRTYELGFGARQSGKRSQKQQQNSKFSRPFCQRPNGAHYPRSLFGQRHTQSKLFCAVG